MGRPKQFIELLGKPALLHTLRAFEETAGIARIYVVGDNERVEALASEGGIGKYVGCAAPGEARPGSTMSGLGLLGTMDEPDDTVVLVHDGSRCLVTSELVESILAAALEPGVEGVIPALQVSDTVKEVRDGVVRETLDRSYLHTVQTPQAFRLGPLREIYHDSGDLFAHVTDDASLVEMRGGEVCVVEGERTNIKLTSPGGSNFRPRHPRIPPRRGREVSCRIGTGYDVHAFAEPESGRKLVLGGVEIPHDRGLSGHSDADVLAHAITDALLGAAGLEDIGHYFPDTDERNRDADSIEMLRVVRGVVGSSWRVSNVDSVVICERPKIRDHRAVMRQNLAVPWTSRPDRSACAEPQPNASASRAGKRASPPRPYVFWRVPNDTEQGDTLG